MPHEETQVVVSPFQTLSSLDYAQPSPSWYACGTEVPQAEAEHSTTKDYVRV